MTNMVGNLYSINYFKLHWDPYGCPKYEGYVYLDDEYVIEVNEITQFTYLQPNLGNLTPVYPLVASIETLVRMQRRRILIDVVGKIITGPLLGRNSTIEMTLQDRSGFVINLILNVTPGALPGMLSRAIIDWWIIYVSRVKLCIIISHLPISRGSFLIQSCQKRQLLRI